MSQIAFAISHYAAIAVLALLAFHIGRSPHVSSVYASVMEEVAFSTSIGLGSIAYLVMVLGLLGLLYTGPVLAVLWLLPPLLPAWNQSVRRLVAGDRGTARAADSRRYSSLPSGAVWFSVRFWHRAVSADRVRLDDVPLRSCQTYVAEHGLVLTPDLRYPCSRKRRTCWFTLALLLFDDVAAQLTQILALALVVIGLIAWAARQGPRTPGCLAAALLPRVHWCCGCRREATWTPWQCCSSR